MSDIENGRRNVSLEIIEKLSNFFELSPSDFVKHIENADLPPLTLDSLKKYLCERGYEESVVLEQPAFMDAVVGVSEDGRVIYAYEKMVRSLMQSDEMDYEEATEFIDYNTLGALPSMGKKAPIVLMEIEE